jgi:hypothetical protein
MGLRPLDQNPVGLRLVQPLRLHRHIDTHKITIFFELIGAFYEILVALG